jgi:high affinity Mn2+ porin
LPLLFGFTAGYDWRLQSALILGVEGDIEWADIQGTAPNPNSPVGGNCWSGGDQTASCGTKVGSLGDITARLGFLLSSDTLLYGKAGVAFVRDVFGVTGITPGGGCSFFKPDYPSTSQTRTAATFGVGLEHKFTPQTSIFAEYDYTNLGNAGVTFVSPGSGCTPTFTPSIAQNLQVVKVGLNWKLF